MLAQLRPAIVLTVLFTLLLGLAYPLAITGIGQAAFPAQANGSRIERDGVLIGSSLIGQNFAGAGYFHPRPSAVDYNAASSGASNLGPTSTALRDAIVERTAALALAAPAPADAVTTSGSGLDPHISPAFAQTQIARIAARRLLALHDLVDQGENRLLYEINQPLKHLRLAGEVPIQGGLADI